ncbi:ATP phosphoribosyltransferase [Christensenellaceae bacterium OttesenSCG-928-K19]|nr:ATP phosphoribosyltransferase [Christensenellaceae bacterium OttesenSCG-928-K19]
MLTIALAKGRLAKYSIELFEKCSIDTSELREDTRKLVVYDKKNDTRFVLVKPSDVPVYVYRGVADIGIAGKDTLLEAGLPLYEMLDLGYAACKICVAGYENKGNGKITSNRLRVATKYPRVAKMHYDSKGEDIEIIKLNGSIELAPILDLSDVIVDIVESGNTIRENGLSILEDICTVSARLVVNQVSLKTKADAITPLIGRMKQALEEM